MKWLTYRCKVKTGNGKERTQIKMVKADEKGRALAAQEAVGEVIEKDDGKVAMPTDKERLEALENAVAYLLGLKNDGSFMAELVQLGRVSREDVPQKYHKDMEERMKKYR